MVSSKFTAASIKICGDEFLWSSYITHTMVTVAKAIVVINQSYCIITTVLHLNLVTVLRSVAYYNTNVFINIL